MPLDPNIPLRAAGAVPDLGAGASRALSIAQTFGNLRIQQQQRQVLDMEMKKRTVGEVLKLIQSTQDVYDTEAQKALDVSAGGMWRSSEARARFKADEHYQTVLPHVMRMLGVKPEDMQEEGFPRTYDRKKFEGLEAAWGDAAIKFETLSPAQVEGVGGQPGDIMQRQIRGAERGKLTTVRKAPTPVKGPTGQTDLGKAQADFNAGLIDQGQLNAAKNTAAGNMLAKPQPGFEWVMADDGITPKYQPIPGSTGALAARKEVSGMRKEFERAAGVWKDSIDMHRAAMAAANDGAGDIVLIKALATLTEPGGRVTDAEYDQGAQTGGMPGTWRGWAAFLTGGGKLAQPERDRLRAQISQLTLSRLEAQQALQTRYQGLASGIEAQAGDVVRDLTVGAYFDEAAARQVADSGPKGVFDFFGAAGGRGGKGGGLSAPGGGKMAIPAKLRKIPNLEGSESMRQFRDPATGQLYDEKGNKVQ